jgi:hypothetical protein
MLRDLVKLADHLDRKGLSKEANFLDGIIKKATEHSDQQLEGMIEELGGGLSGDQRDAVSQSFERFPVSSQGLMTPEGHDDGHSQSLQDLIKRIEALSPEDKTALRSTLTAGGPVDL